MNLESVGLAMSARRLMALVERHERWRRDECVNLIPSENVTSPLVRKLLSSDMGHRYTSTEGFYMGTRYMDEVERLGEEIARILFGAPFADLRPISGHVADMIVVSSICKPGDKILTVSPDHGGYPGISEKGYPGAIGLRSLYFPFDLEAMNIAVEDAAALIEAEKPKLAIFGSSFIPFPHPVSKLSKVCRENNCIVAYDASHVLGLIAGGLFQQPLKEGAKIMMGSTHKSLFGPQGGVILCDEDYSDIIRRSVHPAFVDNAHWNRIAALTAALAEAKRFGIAYARRVVENSKALARALDEGGVGVRGKEKGYTESHQVILDLGSLKKSQEVALRLQEANIIVDSGVRLGTNEVTRLGMGAPDMETIAEFIIRIVVKGERPRKVKREVVKFRRAFRKVRFC